MSRWSLLAPAAALALLVAQPFVAALAEPTECRYPWAAR